MNRFVNEVRSLKKISTLNLVKNLTDDFVPLFGDGHEGIDDALISGLGLMNKKAVMITGIQRGNNAAERTVTHNGSLRPKGYRTCFRLFEQAEQLNIPILTIIDTPGAYCDLNSEKSGQAQAISKLIEKMSILKVPIVSLILGEGGSGGALGLLVSDYRIATSVSMLSTISPEGYSEIMWKKVSPQNSDRALNELHAIPEELKKENVIDLIIEEPNLVKNETIFHLGQTIDGAFQKYLNLDKEELIKQRQDKFDLIGRKYIEYA
ncbi:carboxyl transferase domain-containing protein [Lapidilactobacillus mulanensis]|uniref:acetyl-CoA carboxytransferase n=2 Tax=Lactobacillaceae TaxID=33958 RepID=A0ABW4DN74_9LACO|nr:MULTISPECIES: carboxyl transferase domain-containing protein [Lactobacillaceae]